MNKIGIISTVKTQSSQLHLFVKYHLNIGINDIFLFFDDPEDKSINSFSNYSGVHVVSCSTQYWQQTAGKRPDSIEERQIVNVNKGAEYLASHDCNWLIHIDSDEIINPLVPLNQVLNNTSADAIRFSMLEAISEREDYDHVFCPTLFRKMASNNQIKLAEILGCSNAIFHGEYFRGHTASKMAVRVKNNISYGIHGPKVSSKATIENTNSIQLLHYDGVDINAWKTKWDRRIDESAKAIRMSENRKMQFLLYQKAKKEGDESISFLFKKMHGLKINEKIILHILGMLTSVHITPDLFEHNQYKRHYLSSQDDV